ncbi:response regulator [Vibrio atypicus]|uniref:response regulator n=1 Tax=Vibrio atypicus TaxID=558271 RepID=UPI00373673F0
MDLFADHRQEDTLDSSLSPVDEVPLHPWKVLLVDDDEQMHQITRLALSGFEFDGRGLELVSAYSALEAQSKCQQEPDFALALVDVVMESDHAGLGLVKFIREELQNRVIRLVLRTGQAGQAPEDTVIREYEIDDYKEKTELTTQKLKTLLYSMLRSYRDLKLIEAQKEGLKKVIKSSAKVQNTTTLQAYASSVLEQLTSLLQLEESAFYCLVKPRPQGEESRSMTLAASGSYVDCYSECAFDKLPPEVSERCLNVLTERQSKNFGDAFVLFASDHQGVDSILYVNYNRELNELDFQLLEIYMQNIGLTFENLSLLIDIKETSKELVYNLANAVEARSKETGAHVQRVALICERLAVLYGLSDEEALMIKLSAPLHDVGKVAVPDSILHKPGKLDAQEWEIMKKHVDYGVDILSKSKRRLIVVAKEIAGHHHEKWDGSGYPNGLSGADIPISGRIAALADVFDALGAKRSYKEPWSDAEILAEIQKQSGLHFEPKLVELMINHWQDFIDIRNSLPD